MPGWVGITTGSPEARVFAYCGTAGAVIGLLNVVLVGSYDRIAANGGER